MWFFNKTQQVADVPMFTATAVLRPSGAVLPSPAERAEVSQGFNQRSSLLPRRRLELTAVIRSC